MRISDWSSDVCSSDLVTETPARTFTVTLADEGAISVPFDPRDTFGKARPPVVVTLNGHSYRSTIAIMGGVTFVPMSRSNREKAGVAGSDTNEVTLTTDTSTSKVTQPHHPFSALYTPGLQAPWGSP